MPIRYLESHAPFIIPAEVIAWAVKFYELDKKTHHIGGDIGGDIGTDMVLKSVKHYQP